MLSTHKICSLYWEIMNNQQQILNIASENDFDIKVDAQVQLKIILAVCDQYGDKNKRKIATYFGPMTIDDGKND